MSSFPMGEIMQAAEHGSPALLHAFGRLFGLGEAERSALFGGNGVPGWAWLAIGVTAGTAAGIWAHGRWPRQTERLIGR